MKLAAAAAVLLASITSAFADPTGTYEVEGTNPGGSGAYHGTVTVEPTGDTYRVVWRIGKQRYIGTAIYKADVIAVSYRSGRNTGLAIYARDPASKNWEGVWTYADGRRIGNEKWFAR